MHLHTICCATLLALTASAAAQQPPPTPVSTLIQQLRDRRLDMGARSRLVDEILTRGESGARSLHSFAKADYATRYKRYRKSHEKHLKVFAAGARRMFAARRDKGTVQKIEALQEKARGLSRQRNLSKNLIRSEIDPIVDQLTKLLVIPVRKILTDPKQKKLRTSTMAIEAELARLRESFATAKRARDAFGETTAGARQIQREKPPVSPASFADELADEREWLAILARPMTKRDAKLLVRNHELRDQIGYEEYAGILDLNLLRLRVGKSVLAIDVKLCVASRGHSEDMQRLKFFSHTSPVPGKRSPGQRAAAAGTSGGAENIARGARDGKGAIRQWWYSPGHHKNMMRGGGRVGLGQAQRFWTQMFG